MGLVPNNINVFGMVKYNYELTRDRNGNPRELDYCKNLTLSG